MPTYGNTTLEAAWGLWRGSDSPMLMNDNYSFSILGSTERVDTIRIYGFNNGSSITVEVGVYNITGGVASAPLVVKGTIAIGAADPEAWYSIDVSGQDINLVSGQTYAIGIASSNGGSYNQYRTVGGAATNSQAGASNVVLPDPWSDVGSYDRDFNMAVDTTDVVAGPTVDSVDAQAGTITDVSIDGAQAQISAANGGTAYAGVYTVGSSPSHAEIVAGSGTGYVSGPDSQSITGDPQTVTFGTIAGLTASTNYELWVTAVDSGAGEATPVMDAFTTNAQQLSIVIPLVNVETGAAWPDARTIEWDLWRADNWHNTSTPQAAVENGGDATAGGGVLTINTFALQIGDPTFVVMYEEEGTTPGFSPDDFFGVSRQNSVVNALVDLNGAAQYVESPDASGAWVPTLDYIASKQTMRRTVVMMSAPPSGSTFRCVFDFDVPSEMLALDVWRALGAGPPDNAASSVTPVDIRTLDVSFTKEYSAGANAILQFRGVITAAGNSIPNFTWPRQSPS